MALLNTWSVANRVIRQNIASSFTRENIAATDSDVFVYGAAVPVAYYKYTRTRTKQYSYIGMTREAALRCAAAMNALYSRAVYRWVFDSQQKVWEMQSTPTMHDMDYVRGGTATLEYIAGCSWAVNISVNESITIPYRTAWKGSPPTSGDADEMPYPWRDFETNPAKLTDYFRGRAATSTEQQYGLLQDFDYDERDVGWGSDEDLYHDHFVLDANAQPITKITTTSQLS